MIFIFIVTLSAILSSISLKQAKPKFCINCKHFLTDNMDNTYGRCLLFPNSLYLSNYLVNGEKKINKEDFYYCSTAREKETMCGKNAKFYKKNIQKKHVYKIIKL